MKIYFLFFLIFISPLFGQNITPERILELAKNREEVFKIEAENFAKSFSFLQKTILPDSSDYDQLYFDLNFIITYDPQNFEGTVTGQFRSNINGLNQIKLNFDSREDYPPYWSNFAVTGNVSGYTHSNWILRVLLDRTYNLGDTFSVTVHYSGIPRASGLAGFLFSGGVFTLSEPYSAQTWWPCKDDPADKLDSVRISVTVPANMLVASNGLLIEQTVNPNNSKTFVWKERYPITTYLISLAVDAYSTFSDSFEYSPGNFMPIEYYVYASQLANAQAAFSKLPNMLDSFSRLFGLYPFITEKYGQAVFPWGGAMEHQTCTSIGSVNTGWETVYAHELAHQWFGDLVTCNDWHHIWVNEGFATYSEAIWMEDFYGDAAFHDYVNSSLSNSNFNGAFVPAIYRYDIGDPHSIFSWTVYIKGMWVLHMLRHVVGDSIFFQIMHDYPNDPTFAFKTATTEQFCDFCEASSGINLDWFFQQWIYQEYYPVYDWGYSHYQLAGQDYLNLVIKQKQNLNGYQHLYKMPIDIILYYPDLTRDTLMVWDSLITQTFEIPIDRNPVTATFDKDNWILKKASFIPITQLNQPLDLTGSFNLYQNYPNPFNEITKIPFSLDAGGYIKMEIYDVVGRKIRTLVNGYCNYGRIISWDGKDDQNRVVASGIYIYRIQYQHQNLSRKMLLVR
jgi:aminopeptidase N